MSARDELAEVIAAGYGTDESPCPYDHAPAIADAILADGCRKPRTVEGMDAIHMLPEGSIIHDMVEVLTLREDTNNCTLEWHDEWGAICNIQFPATVLYEPEARS